MQNPRSIGPPYRGTSIIRNTPPVGPYGRTMRRLLGEGAVSYDRGTTLAAVRILNRFTNVLNFQLCSPRCLCLSLSLSFSLSRSLSHTHPPSLYLPHRIGCSDRINPQGPNGPTGLAVVLSAETSVLCTLSRSLSFSLPSPHLTPLVL